MKTRDSLGIQGKIKLVLKDQSGNVKDVREVKNLVVDTGEEHVADRLAATPAQLPITLMKLGTGTTDPSGGMTALQGTILHSQLLDNGYPQVDVGTPNSVIYMATFGTGEGTGSVTEAGLFTSDSPDNIMVAMQKFDAVVKGANDILEVTWTLVLG
jgi:hypothetical protein